MTNLIHDSATNLIINLDQIALLEYEDEDPESEMPGMIKLTTSGGAPLMLPAKGALRIWEKLVEISIDIEQLGHSDNTR